MTAFEQLEPEYARLVSSAKVDPSREREVEIVCEHLLNDRDLYGEVSAKTAVPIAVLMALAEREMTGNTYCYLGNGQPLNRRTTIVPIGRGPWNEPHPDNFIAGCVDALHLDGLDQYAQEYGWSLPLLGYASENWNGWGYRARGIPSPYFVGATTAQRPGKFIRDHVYSPTMMDPQIGTLAIVEELVRQDPSLAFFDPIPKTAASPPQVQPHPVMGNTPIGRVQDMLNQLKSPGTPLVVDGNCGRGTRAAVWEYQRLHHLVADGLPGPKTYASLLQSMAEEGM